VEVEEKIKEVLRIPKEEVLVSLVKEVIKGRTYYRVITYAKGEGKRHYRVKKAVESEVLRLWQKYLEEKQAVEFLTLRKREEKERLERKLKEVLKIPQEETLSCMVKEVVKGRTYYGVITYCQKSKKAKKYRVRRALEEEVLRLWQEILQKEEEIKRILERFQSLKPLATKKVY